MSECESLSEARWKSIEFTSASCAHSSKASVTRREPRATRITNYYFNQISTGRHKMLLHCKPAQIPKDVQKALSHFY